MILCDTSVWIEYFRKRSPYFEILSSMLNKGNVLGLECIFGELLQGVIGKEERKIILECWKCIPHYEEGRLFLEAGEFSAIHRLQNRGIGLIDAAIAIATFRSNSALWTLDKKLLSLVPEKHRYR
jgi:predicted nucleic acid-binding protein